MLTQARLKELLRYNRRTGVFVWRVDRGTRQFKGKIAGSVDWRGYRFIPIDGKRCLAHRLAFLYVEGRLPKNYVDHKNGIPSDNRWKNLRHATVRQNAWNRGPRLDGSGVNGVQWDSKANHWRVRIQANKIRYSVGRFDDFDQAVKAKNEFCLRMYGEYAAELRPNE